MPDGLKGSRNWCKEVELINIPHHIYSFIGKMRASLAGIGKLKGHLEISGDEGTAYFYDDHRFRADHEVLRQGWFIISDRDSTAKVFARLKDSTYDSESSLSRSASS